jgi:tRNA G18 (ribose-2'-O)-methylase SpoU
MKGVKKTTEYIYGINSVMAVLAGRLRTVDQILITHKDNPRLNTVINKAHSLQVPVKITNNNQLEKVIGKVSHQSIVAKC